MSHIKEVAESMGVRCIGLGQMMRETGILEAVKDDCEQFGKRFPDGQAGYYDGERVKVRRMVFDELNFPFYRVVFDRGNETLMVGSREIGTSFRWSTI